MQVLAAAFDAIAPFCYPEHYGDHCLKSHHTPLRDTVTLRNRGHKRDVVTYIILYYILEIILYYFDIKKIQTENCYKIFVQKILCLSW